MNLEHTDIVIQFWDNLDYYIKNDKVIEEIDNVFPLYLFDNVEYYTKIFYQVSELYNTFFITTEDLNIDFNISYADCCRHIVKSLKETYIQNKNLFIEDIEDIIHDMYYNKYLEYVKNNNISNIVANLIK